MSDIVVKENTELALQPSTPIKLIEMAIESGKGVDELGKLLDLQERWEAGQAKKAFYDAMAKFQSNCPNIYKTKRAHNSAYTPLGDIVAQIRDLLASCGLSIRFEQNHTNAIEVTCIVTHRDGHSEKTSMIANPDSSGSKNQIQAVASTVTYLQRYTLIGALGITTADVDMDGRLPQDTRALVNPIESITRSIQSQGKNTEQFFTWASQCVKRQVSSFDDLSDDELQHFAKKMEGKK